MRETAGESNADVHVSMRAAWRVHDDASECLVRIHDMSRVAITGALSYTGRYLTRLLLDTTPVSSIVSFSSRRNPIASNNITDADLAKIETTPLTFADLENVKRQLEGVDVFYCTYWIRFEANGDTHQKAAARIRSVFEAAAEAGVKKLVFSAHNRMRTDSPYSYIAGKAKAVESLREVSAKTGMNYAVVRPCGLFGETPGESILMNNASWVLRRTPLFLLPGDGSGRFQPVHVNDMAELMADLGTRSMDTSGEEKDASGPDCPTGKELFTRLGRSIGAPAVVMATGLPNSVVSTLTQPINWLQGDVLLDDDDLSLLGESITMADQPDDPLIQKRRSLFEWIEQQKDDLGREYISSFARYYKK